VLFFVFYNMPHDKAQLHASIELQTRGWFFIQDSMRWVKPAAKKEPKKKNGGKSKKADITITVFNPQLWKEEEVLVLED